MRKHQVGAGHPSEECRAVVLTRQELDRSTPGRPECSLAGRSAASSSDRVDTCETWCPLAAGMRRQIADWLTVARQIEAAASRHSDPISASSPTEGADLIRDWFAKIEDHLADGEVEGRCWLAGACPTVADVACLPLVLLAPERRIPLTYYPALRRWTGRMRGLPIHPTSESNQPG
jgi:glutathione S-transferase